MTTINILDTTQTITFSEEGSNRLVAAVNEPIGRKYTRVITINKSTFEYVDQIISIIGEEYESNISIVADNKMDFGVVMLTKKDMYAFGQPEIERENIILIRRSTGSFDTDLLDQATSLYNPSFILMSQDTMNGIAKTNPDAYDVYQETGRAFYHSYNKIPVAVTNFLSLGEIKIIEE